MKPSRARLAAYFAALLAIPFATSTAGAQTPAPSPSGTEKDQHIKMHETLAKAHSEAATCLKAGKPVNECREAFRKGCNDAGDEGMCGMKRMRKGNGKHRPMKD